jgi:hypothetical protein
MGRRNQRKGNKRAHSEEPQTSPPKQKRAKTTDISPRQVQNAPNPTPPQIPKHQPRQPREPPPEPPHSVPASHILLPPEADDVKLRNGHDLHTISISASSKIESKVRQVLAVLQPQVDGSKRGDEVADAGETKAFVVALTARAPAGNKCISVAEIAKRELKCKCWQYTGCWTRLETLESKSKEHESEKRDGATDQPEAGREVEDEEPAFEDVPERKLVRNTVCMVIYLSAEPVGRLKELYSEQITESKKP